MDTADLQLTTKQVLGPNIGKLRTTAIGMLVVGAIASGVAAVMNLQAFFQSYLFAYIFWFGMTAGSFGLLVLHHTVGGGWAFTIRRFLEAASNPKTWAVTGPVSAPKPESAINTRASRDRRTMRALYLSAGAPRGPAGPCARA